MDGNIANEYCSNVGKPLASEDVYPVTVPLDSMVCGPLGLLTLSPLLTFAV